VIFAEGYQMKPGESVISPSQVDVTPGYFEAMGVRLVGGRFFVRSSVGRGTDVAFQLPLPELVPAHDADPTLEATVEAAS